MLGFTAFALLIGLVCLLGVITTSPQPAKQAAAKAYNNWNLAVFTVGAKSSNTINVAVQLQDARGQNLVAQVMTGIVWLSDNPAGTINITGTGTTSAIAIGTNGTIFNTVVANKAVQVITNATGQFDLNIIQTASPVAYYLCMEMPDGSIQVSPVIQF